MGLKERRSIKMKEIPSFEWALKQLKKGEKVCREGWNGKDMFIYLVKKSEIKRQDLRNEAAKYCTQYVGEYVKICPHIDMKAADGSIVIGWLASQTDMLSEDWMIAE